MVFPVRNSCFFRKDSGHQRISFGLDNLQRPSVLLKYLRKKKNPPQVSQKKPKLDFQLDKWKKK